MASEDIIKNISRETSNALKEMAVREPAEIPAHLRGKLSKVLSSVANEESEVPVFVPGNVVFRGSDPLKGLRSSAYFLELAASEFAKVKNFEGASQAASVLKNRLLSTGCYRDVSVGMEVKGSGNPDIAVELNETTFSLQSGINTSMQGGQFDVGTKFVYSNVFGNGEQLSAEVGSASAELFDSQGLMSVLSADMPSAVKRTAARTQEILTTSVFTGEYRQPTIFGRWNPISLRLKKSVDMHDLTRGHRTNLSEVDFSVSNASNDQSITYSLSLRQGIPIPHPSNPFLTSTSPEVVQDCDASLKSSLSHSWVFSHVNNGNPGPLTNGVKGFLRTELAGIGGDVFFLKSFLSTSAAFSLGRYAPDTGYELPKTKTAFMKDRLHEARGFDLEPSDSGLLPHPGKGIFCRKSCKKNSTCDNRKCKKATNYTLGHQLAGWLSPGIVTLFDISGGFLFPIGRDSYKTTNPTRIHDRFFLNDSFHRGYHSIGPRANPVDGGVSIGDNLGGDAFVATSVRVKLPFFLPSVRLANAGLSTQLWVSAASIAKGDEIQSPHDLISLASMAAGVGVTIPLGPVANLEFNWTLWNKSSPRRNDVAAKFKLQFTL